DIGASLSEFEAVVTAKGDHDVAARFSDLRDTGSYRGVSGNRNDSAPSRHATIARDDECQCERLDSGGSLNLRQAISELGHVYVGSEHLGWLGWSGGLGYDVANYKAEQETGEGGEYEAKSGHEGSCWSSGLSKLAEPYRQLKALRR